MTQDDKKIKKKRVISLIVGVAVLTLLVIGASFAYFNVSTNVTTTSTDGRVTAQGLGNVYLEGTSADLSLALTNENLMLSNANTTYYGTDDGTPDTEMYLAEVGTTSVEGAGTFNCSYTLSLTASGDMQSAFKNMDGAYYDQLGVVILSGSDEQDALDTLDNYWSDFETDENTGIQSYTGNYLLYDEDEDYYYIPGDLFGDFPVTIAGELNGLTENNNKGIYAYLYFLNTEDDQTELSGTYFNVDINVTSFTCEKGEAEEEHEFPTITLTIENNDPITLAEEDFVIDDQDSNNLQYSQSLEQITNSSTTTVKTCSYTYAIAADGTFVDLYDTLIIDSDDLYFGVDSANSFLLNYQFNNISLSDIINAQDEYVQQLDFTVDKATKFGNKTLATKNSNTVYLHIPNNAWLKETFEGTTLNLYISKISGTCS